MDADEQLQLPVDEDVIGAWGFQNSTITTLPCLSSPSTRAWLAGTPLVRVAALFGAAFVAGVSLAAL